MNFESFLKPLLHSRLFRMTTAVTILSGSATADIVTYDFETDPGGLVGTAQIVNGQLQLTTNTGDNQAAFHIPPVTDSSKGFVVTFDFTIIDRTNWRRI